MTPFYVGLHEGDTVRITCFSSTPVYWTFNDQYLPDRINNVLVYLYITEAVQQDTGIYKCFGTSGDGSGFIGETTVHVGGKTL